MKILTIVGNRPQFIKLGVTARQLRLMGDEAPFQSIVINTGQHYDQMLSDVFFTELQIEPPQYDLGIGSGHIVDQIGKMLSPVREIVEHEKPDGILVYGDTNSTVAGAIVAAHLDIPLIHVEGGERLYRRSAMPEEVNRVVTDHLADACLASSQKAVRYLKREGFNDDRVTFVGDPMYDIFKLTGEMLKDRKAAEPEAYGLASGEYALCTVHRAENTDDRETCLGILRALDDGSIPVLLPAHPRLKSRLQDWGWEPTKSLQLIEPLGYFDFQSILRSSCLVVTDSGGVGREAFFAGKGCIVPLESSAWIEAVEAGMSVMVGQNPERLAHELENFRPTGNMTALVEDNFGTGEAGKHIVNAVADMIEVGGRNREGPWHPVARFENLPKASDSSHLSLSAFREILSEIVNQTPEPGLVLHDITESTAGVDLIADAEREAGLKGTYCLDLGNARYNPFDEKNGGIIERLVKDGHQLAVLGGDDNDAARMSKTLGLHFGTQVSRCRYDTALSDLDEEYGSIEQLNEAIVSGRGVLLHPAYWHENPVYPFESKLCVFDELQEESVKHLRAEI